jgi:hypothetical protein
MKVESKRRVTQNTIHTSRNTDSVTYILSPGDVMQFRNCELCRELSHAASHRKKDLKKKR